jgi:hypothetical protein
MTRSLIQIKALLGSYSLDSLFLKFLLKGPLSSFVHSEYRVVGGALITVFKLSHNSP